MQCLDAAEENRKRSLAKENEREREKLDLPLNSNAIFDDTAAL